MAQVIGQRNLKNLSSQLVSGSSLQNEGSFGCGGGLEFGLVVVVAKHVTKYNITLSTTVVRNKLL